MLQVTAAPAGCKEILVCLGAIAGFLGEVFHQGTKKMPNFWKRRDSAALRSLGKTEKMVVQSDFLLRQNKSERDFNCARDRVDAFGVA